MAELLISVRFRVSALRVAQFTLLSVDLGLDGQKLSFGWAFYFGYGGDLMRYYKDWGVCSYEEHKLLVLADAIYRNQHPNRVKGKPSEYSIKPPVLKARHN